MTKYSIQNWENLSSDNPEFVALRNEVLHQLIRVPEPHRSVWEGRLKNKLEHAHSSARLEICLHDFFRKRGWEIEIEPELPVTPNKPDFLLTDRGRSVMVEARAVLGADSERQQDNRLMQLTDDLRGKLKRTVLIHPMLDLPSSLPNKRIAKEIESRTSEVGLLQEFLVKGEHQGQPYSLEVTVLWEAKLPQSADVGGTVGQVVEVDIGHPVRKAIMEKAHKYGELLIPFVIAIWPKLPYHFSFGDDDDFVALYGDKAWQDSDYSELRDVIKPSNGIFTIRGKDGTHRYSEVSAVLFCHPYKTDPPNIYIYHNPFAKRPIGMKVFKGIPQCTIDLATGRAQWSYQ
ncbi:MAG: hypothetical protein OXD46_04885 [Chloroflexi bacterium]|nr:hypothetical protein [Chloroflexota bacterium]